MSNNYEIRTLSDRRDQSRRWLARWIKCLLVAIVTYRSTFIGNICLDRYDDGRFYKQVIIYYFLKKAKRIQIFNSRLKCFIERLRITILSLKHWFSNRKVYHSPVRFNVWAELVYLQYSAFCCPNSSSGGVPAYRFINNIINCRADGERDVSTKLIRFADPKTNGRQLCWCSDDGRSDEERRVRGGGGRVRFVGRRVRQDRNDRRRVLRHRRPSKTKHYRQCILNIWLNVDWMSARYSILYLHLRRLNMLSGYVNSN